MITVSDIYKEIDRLAPFATQEKWDNSGLLAGDPKKEVTRVITALDITKAVVNEAENIGAELIISHHPVIFSPLRSVMTDTVTGMLISKGISAICTHTPFDIATCGMNKGLYDILCEPLGLDPHSELLEDMGNGLSVGKIYNLNKPLYAKEVAEIIKEALGCSCVRVAGDGIIKRIAISSGSGGSLVDIAREKGADALASGDFKHDVLIDAPDSGLIIIDCGHFHTERIFAPIMQKLLTEAFPEIDVRCAESCKDPAAYI